MISISFSLDNSAILEVAKLELFYLGEELKDSVDNPEIAANIQAGSDKDDIFKHYLNAEESILSGVFSDLSSVRLNDNPSVDALVPDTFDMNQIGTISEAFKYYLAYLVISRWLQVTLPDKAQYYLALATDKRKEINNRLIRRTKPIVRPVLPLGF